MIGKLESLLQGPFADLTEARRAAQVEVDGLNLVELIEASEMN